MDAKKSWLGKYLLVVFGAGIARSSCWWYAGDYRKNRGADLQQPLMRCRVANDDPNLCIRRASALIRRAVGEMGKVRRHVLVRTGAAAADEKSCAGGTANRIAF